MKQKKSKPQNKAHIAETPSADYLPGDLLFYQYVHKSAVREAYYAIVLGRELVDGEIKLHLWFDDGREYIYSADSPVVAYHMRKLA